MKDPETTPNEEPEIESSEVMAETEAEEPAETPAASQTETPAASRTETPPDEAPPDEAPPVPPAEPPATSYTEAMPAPPARLPGGYAEPRYAAPPAPVQNPLQKRTPWLASFFSLFPGLGNVYNGLYLRGITFFVIIFGLIGVGASSSNRSEGPLIFLIMFVWLFNIFDAYRQATLINYGYTADLELPSRQRLPAWSPGGLVLGVAVFLIGFYFFLHNRFDFDLSILFDNFDLLLMAFGALLIVRWVTAWKKSQAESTGRSEALGNF